MPQSSHAATQSLTIPANTTAWLPLTGAEAADYKLNGQPIQQSKLATSTQKDQQAGFVLAAGTYHLEVTGIH